MTKEEKQITAQELRRYYDTHGERHDKINVCTGRANWNACAFIDCNLQDYDKKHGCKCWKQDSAHKCIRLTEITK